MELMLLEPLFEKKIRHYYGKIVKYLSKHPIHSLYFALVAYSLSGIWKTLPYEVQEYHCQNTFYVTPPKLREMLGCDKIVGKTNLRQEIRNLKDYIQKNCDDTSKTNFNEVISKLLYSDQRMVKNLFEKINYSLNEEDKKYAQKAINLNLDLNEEFINNCSRSARCFFVVDFTKKYMTKDDFNQLLYIYHIIEDNANLFIESSKFEKCIIHYTKKFNLLNTIMEIIFKSFYTEVDTNYYHKIDVREEKLSATSNWFNGGVNNQIIVFNRQDINGIADANGNFVSLIFMTRGYKNLSNVNWNQHNSLCNEGSTYPTIREVLMLKEGKYSTDTITNNHDMKNGLIKTQKLSNRMKRFVVELDLFCANFKLLEYIYDFNYLTNESRALDMLFTIQNKIYYNSGTGKISKQSLSTINVNGRLDDSKKPTDLYENEVVHLFDSKYNRSEQYILSENRLLSVHTEEEKEHRQKVYTFMMMFVGSGIYHIKYQDTNVFNFVEDYFFYLMQTSLTWNGAKYQLKYDNLPTFRFFIASSALIGGGLLWLPFPLLQILRLVYQMKEKLYYPESYQEMMISNVVSFFRSRFLGF
tara:strand:- start:2654 stop:4402 length:1749 start_codon:yes stop_codon:yes gene_type:complete